MAPSATPTGSLPGSQRAPPPKYPPGAGRVSYRFGASPVSAGTDRACRFTSLPVPSVRGKTRCPPRHGRPRQAPGAANPTDMTAGEVERDAAGRQVTRAGAVGRESGMVDHEQRRRVDVGSPGLGAMARPRGARGRVGCGRGSWGDDHRPVAPSTPGAGRGRRSGGSARGQTHARPSGSRGRRRGDARRGREHTGTGRARPSSRT